MNPEYKKLVDLIGEENARKLIPEYDERNFANAKDVPAQDWQKKTSISGFDYVKQQAAEQAKLFAEYENTKKEIETIVTEFCLNASNKIDQNFIDFNSLLKEIEKKLQKEGLVRYQNEYKIGTLKFEPPSITFEIEYITFFNKNVVLADESLDRKIPKENFDPIRIEVTINF